VSAGTYSLTAVATDNTGLTATSAARTITVNPPLSPRTVTFTASPDHQTLVSSYLLEIFPTGGDPVNGIPIASQNVGKPPVVNGDCSADVTVTINPLLPGNYLAVVAAIGTGGKSRSAPFTFTR
jgi:hypothetical protein